MVIIPLCFLKDSVIQITKMALLATVTDWVMCLPMLELELTYIT